MYDPRARLFVEPGAAFRHQQPLPDNGRTARKENAMRSFIALFMFLSILLFSGCGGGGGGSSGSSAGGGGGGVTPPPNPNNGIATFANGVAFDTNLDSVYHAYQNCSLTLNSSWQFLTYGYTLNGYGTEATKTIAFACYGDYVMGGIIHLQRLRMTYSDGTVEMRYIATATNGGLYLLKLSGAGSDDFEITSFSQSPQPFLGPSLALNSTWNGGFSGHDMMQIVGVNVTAPGGETGCFHIRQTVGTQVTEWWYLPNDGFVDTSRSTNGYQRAAATSIVPSGFSRTPFGNG